MATQEDQSYKALQETEATIQEHLKEMHTMRNPPFDDWLACNQVLIQIHQAYLLQGIFDTLNSLRQNGIAVRSMNPFSEF